MKVISDKVLNVLMLNQDEVDYYFDTDEIDVNIKSGKIKTAIVFIKIVAERLGLKLHNKTVDQANDYLILVYNYGELKFLCKLSLDDGDFEVIINGNE